MTNQSDSERLLPKTFEGTSTQKLKCALSAAEGHVERAADILLTEAGSVFSKDPGSSSSPSSSTTSRATSTKIGKNPEPKKKVDNGKAPKTVETSKHTQPILVTPRPKIILRTRNPIYLPKRRIRPPKVTQADPDSSVRRKSHSGNSMFARSFRVQSKRASPVNQCELDDFEVPATSSVTKSQSKRATPALKDLPKAAGVLLTPPLTIELAVSATTQSEIAIFKSEEERTVSLSQISPPESPTYVVCVEPTFPLESAQAERLTPESTSSSTFASQNGTPADTASPVSINPTTTHNFSGTSTSAPTEAGKGKLGKSDADSDYAALLGGHITSDVLSEFDANDIIESSTTSSTNRSATPTLSSSGSSLELGFDSLEFIMKIFPNADQDECEDALRKYDGDCSRALEMMEKNRPQDLLEDPFLAVGTSEQNNGKSVETEGPTLTWSVENDKIAEQPERLESSSASSRNSFSNSSSEDTREAELREARKQKRRAEPEKEVSPVKRRRSNTSAPDLEIAKIWVNTNYGHNETGVSIIYHRDDKLNTHRCKFPLTILSKAFPKLKVTHVKGVPQITLAVGISCDIFSLALQWTVCKNIRIDPTRYPRESQQIELILCTVHFAEDSGLLGFSADMVKHIKPLLIKNRSALQPLFITAAQTLHPKHPLQELFVKASMKSYFEHREDPNRQDMTALKSFQDGYRDEAHRIAFEGNIWKFDSCIKDHPRFELAVMRMAREMWWKREVTKTPGGVKAGGGKIVTVVYDPFDGNQLML